jgi:hypothetical protein
VETYVKDNKENLAVAHGDRLVKEEGELKAKKGKGKKKSKAGKHCNQEPYIASHCHYCAGS